MFREAFKFLPDGTYVHKQDVFLKESYCPDIAGGSFLDRADARHFRGRLYVSHTCVMHFVLSGLKSLEKAYISSPLSYKENLHKERSEERRVGKECLRLCRSRWSPYH